MKNVENIKTNLMEETEAIEHIYKLWELYETAENIYYGIPLPNEINRIYDNEIGYNNFSNPNYIEEYKEKLKFYKKVAEVYDKNDFVVDNKFTDALFMDYNKILDYYISPALRRRVHEICKELEESIETLEYEYFNNH